jgi:hypothetical protein
MKLPIVLLAAAAVWAQPPLKSVTAVTTAEKPALSFAVMADLEKQLDDKVSMAGGAPPMQLLGPARALYLPGYGAVVTQEVSVIVTPTITPFHQSISPKEVAQVHQQKAARLPLMRQTIKDMWTHTANTLNMVPNNEQIVVAVRLLYKSWEDTNGLPGQITLKGSRSAGIAGAQMDEQ